MSLWQPSCRKRTRNSQCCALLSVLQDLAIHDTVWVRTMLQARACKILLVLWAALFAGPCYATTYTLGSFFIIMLYLGWPILILLVLIALVFLVIRSLASSPSVNKKLMRGGYYLRIQDEHHWCEGLTFKPEQIQHLAQSHDMDRFILICEGQLVDYLTEPQAIAGRVYEITRVQAES